MRPGVYTAAHLAGTHTQQGSCLQPSVTAVSYAARFRPDAAPMPPRQTALSPRAEAPYTSLVVDVNFVTIIHPTPPAVENHLRRCIQQLITSSRKSGSCDRNHEAVDKSAGHLHEVLWLNNAQQTGLSVCYINTFTSMMLKSSSAAKTHFHNSKPTNRLW